MDRYVHTDRNVNCWQKAQCNRLACSLDKQRDGKRQVERKKM